jgi:hypothetical protein
MAQGEGKFAIYVVIERALQLLSDSFTDVQEEAEKRAEELTAERKLPHVVVEFKHQIQLTRFEIEPDITQGDRTSGTPVSLREHIAQARRIETQERAKELAMIRARRKAKYVPRRKRLDKSDKISTTTLGVQDDETGNGI